MVKYIYRKEVFNMDIKQLSIGLLIPFLGTLLGSAMVFLMKKEMNKRKFVEMLLLVSYKKERTIWI